MHAVKTAYGLKSHRFDFANSWWYVAAAIFRIRPGNRYAVIEVGIDRPGDMAIYARSLRPDIAIVTSIGSEHNRSLGTLESTRLEKSEMVKILPKSGFAILNGDDPNVLWMSKQAKAQVITYGLNSTNDIYATDIRHDWPHGTRFVLHAKGYVRKLRIRLFGKHMIYPILSAAAALFSQGMDPDIFLPALERVSPAPGKMEPVFLSNGAIILRDDFKGSLETFHTALDLLDEIPAERKIIVVGEVSEPPGSKGPIYREIGRRLARNVIRIIHVGSSSSFQQFASGARAAGMSRDALIHVKKSVRKAAEILLNDLGKGDVVLLKGRNNQRLERVGLILAGRPVRCDIDFCNETAIKCAVCPMLESGWEGSTYIR